MEIFGDKDFFNIFGDKEEDQHNNEEREHVIENEFDTREVTELNQYSGIGGKNAINDDNSNDLIPVTALDHQFRSPFPYKTFNRVQSEVFEAVYHSDKSIVVGAPTGSGKTGILELAIVRLLIKRMRAKAVYMAPMKAICQERLQDWRSRFTSLGVKCVELTGDTESVDYGLFKEADIVLTTPEKWDSLTRRWKDKTGLSFVENVGLLLIDEVHLLNEDRGATLEAVISRMKTVRISDLISGKPSSQLRFVAVSATIPNIEDIAKWLGVPGDCIFNFGEEYRPVPLEVVVKGFYKSSNDFIFDRNLTYKVMDIITNYSDGKPALVFCGTRKGTQECASQLQKDSSIENMRGRGLGYDTSRKSQFVADDDHQRRLQGAGSTVHDKQLRGLLPWGIAFHHSGLDVHDRRLVESLFSSGELAALTSTSTLSQGVNLPAHLVIIKNTQQCLGGTVKEIGEHSLMQMTGRAGRPQFDETGVAVIMTSEEKQHRYENLATMSQDVDSHLHRSMIEHMNAEVVLKTITSLRIAAEWLKSTFLYVRMCKSPSAYGLPSGLTEKELENHLRGMCTESLRQLDHHHLIKLSEDGSVTSTNLGKLMARYYISFHTIVLFESINNDSTIVDLIKVLAQAREFDDIALRMSEKKFLNALNNDGKIRKSKKKTKGKTEETLDNEKQVDGKEGLRFPIKGKIKTKEQKIECLLQSILGHKTIDDFSLRMESNNIFNTIVRLARCMTDYLFHRSDEMSVFHVQVRSTILTKCLNQRMWEDSPRVLQQLEGIGDVLVKNLVQSGITSFDILERTDARRIESIVRRNPPFGTQLQALYLSIPQYDMKLVKQDEDTMRIQLLQRETNSHATLNTRITKKSKSRNYYTIIAGSEDGKVLFHNRFSSNLGSSKQLEFYVKNCGTGKVEVHLINEDYIGIDISTTSHFRGGVNIRPQVPEVSTWNSIDIDNIDILSSAIDSTNNRKNKSSTKRQKRQLKFDVDARALGAQQVNSHSFQPSLMTTPLNTSSDDIRKSRPLTTIPANNLESMKNDIFGQSSRPIEDIHHEMPNEERTEDLRGEVNDRPMTAQNETQDAIKRKILHMMSTTARRPQHYGSATTYDMKMLQGLTPHHREEHTSPPKVETLVTERPQQIMDGYSSIGTFSDVRRNLTTPSHHKNEGQRRMNGYSTDENTIAPSERHIINDPLGGPSSVIEVFQNKQDSPQHKRWKHTISDNYEAPSLGFSRRSGPIPPLLGSNGQEGYNETSIHTNGRRYYAEYPRENRPFMEEVSPTSDMTNEDTVPLRKKRREQSTTHRRIVDYV